MDRPEFSKLKYWLALGRVRGLERFNLKGLVERFGGAEEVFAESRRAIEAFSSEFAKARDEFTDWAWAEREIGLIEKEGAYALTFVDKRYPPSLREIFDPPAVLYAKGVMYGHDIPAIAVVGTRRPTPYGQKMAESIGRGLGASGVVVVSGMARGCDAAAHRGALSAGGFTVAVLGTGIGTPYPRENEKLYDEICSKGLVLSEVPVGSPPLPRNFPRRNRIISGLSRGVAVVEAPLRSGSLMTARLALEQGRDVYAVPGQVSSYKSSGTNRLIKDGAALMEGAEDITDALALKFIPERPKEKDGIVQAGSEEKLLLKAIGEGPVHIDSVLEKTGLHISKASALLLELELKGLIRQAPGKLFSRA